MLSYGTGKLEVKRGSCHATTITATTMTTAATTTTIATAKTCSKQTRKRDFRLLDSYDSTDFVLWWSIQ